MRRRRVAALYTIRPALTPAEPGRIVLAYHMGCLSIWQRDGGLRSYPTHLIRVMPAKGYSE